MKINPKFKALIPPLSQEEYSQLEKNILDDGCRDPLVVWNGTLVDGHNRYEICTRHSIRFKTVEKSFKTADDAEIWIIRNQFGRRNLTPFVRGELALKLKPLLAEKAKANRASAGGDKKSPVAKSRSLQPTLVKAIEPVNTQEELAAASGVSKGTLHKIELIAEKAPEQVKEALRTGETTVNAEYKKLTNFVTKNSTENEWYTPPQYIEAAREVMGGIDLDPASSDVAQQTVRAETYYTASDDGLAQEWSGRVWLNPPYSKELIGQFCEKLANSLFGNGGTVRDAVLLVNNATDTQWFHDVIEHASAVCFVKGRISFLDEQGQAKNKPLQGQMLIYFGQQEDRFVGVFSEFGSCLVTPL